MWSIFRFNFKCVFHDSFERSTNTELKISISVCCVQNVLPEPLNIVIIVTT